MRLQSCHAGAVLFQCNLISCKMSCVHGWLLHSAASHSRRRFTDFSLFFPHVTTMMAFHTSTRHATASRQIMTAKWDSSTNYTHVKCHDSKANCCNVPNWDNVSLWSYSMLKKKRRGLEVVHTEHPWNTEVSATLMSQSLWAVSIKETSVYHQLSVANLWTSIKKERISGKCLWVFKKTSQFCQILSCCHSKQCIKKKTMFTSEESSENEQHHSTYKRL